MTDYDKALKALDWLNRNTDYRANNISGDYPHFFKETLGGMFGLSKFSSKESLGVYAGIELVEIAEREVWKDE